MKTNLAIFTLLGALLSGSCAFATIPDVLKGGWMIDAEATVENLKNSPKWDPANAKFLPLVLERMSVVVCTFDEGTMTVSNGLKKDALAVELTSSEARLFVFAGKSGDNEVTIRASLTEEGLLNIRTSTTDDMDYYLWKRTPEGYAPKKIELPPAAHRLLKKKQAKSQKQPAS